MAKNHFKFVDALESDSKRGVSPDIFIAKWHKGLSQGALALASKIFISFCN
jgi:hypothetical protein